MASRVSEWRRSHRAPSRWWATRRLRAGLDTPSRGTRRRTMAAIGVGPYLGGLAAEWWGYRAAFVTSAVGVAFALIVGLVLPIRPPALPTSRSGATFTDIRGNAAVWAGWILSISGLLIQGVVFSFFPLLGHDRGLTPAAIGFVFLVLGSPTRWPGCRRAGSWIAPGGPLPAQSLASWSHLSRRFFCLTSVARRPCSCWWPSSVRSAGSRLSPLA